MLIIVAIVSVQGSTAQAASLTISSPANGQTFTGNDFTVSGTAAPNATIAIIRNGTTLAQARADGSGNWSKNLVGLPDGDNTITVRSISNTGFAYFTMKPVNENSITINQLRLSDNAINVSNAFPVNDTTLHAGLMPSPTQDGIFYTAGTLGGSVRPGKFDANAPADPVSVTGNYPDNSGSNAGAFSADGTKYYSPNLNLPSVSVIDVASNAWVEDITLPGNPITAWRSSAGKIYAAYTVPDQTSKIAIIDPATDTIVKTAEGGCPVDATMATVAFSQDSTYPYYFTPCIGVTGAVVKHDIVSDDIVATYPVDFPPTVILLNLDNSRLYLTSSAGIENNVYADKLLVLDSTNGQVIKTIQLAAGVIGIFQSPDFQHLYASTPGTGFDQTGIDIIDMYTDQVEHVATTGAALTVGSSSTAVTLTNVNVAVVLGVKSAAATTAGTLAKTGVFVALATPVGLFLVAATLYTYLDYRKHKTPLTEASSDVNYSYFHHLKVVSLPLAKYRLSIGVDRQVGDRSDRVRRF